MKNALLEDNYRWNDECHFVENKT